MKKTFLSALLPAGLFASPALAHHPLGGEVPQTVIHGLLSGIGHPIIGFDHLAFILGIGLLAAFQRSWYAMPAAFVAGTIAGTLLILGGTGLPAVEAVIGLSVLLVGALAAFGRRLPAASAAAVAGLAGIFHGWAYGEAVVGAEPTPVLAYLAGFGATQMAVAMAAMLGARLLMGGGRSASMAPRLAGAMVAGVGLTYLAEIAEAMVVPGI